MIHSVFLEYLLWARHYGKCSEKKKKLINDIHVSTLSEIVSVFPKILEI